MQARSDGWKHQTTTTLHDHGETVGVDLFNEREGFTTIYVRYADGHRFPARDVSHDNPKAADIIDAWQARGETRDYRTYACGGCGEHGCECCNRQTT